MKRVITGEKDGRSYFAHVGEVGREMGDDGYREFFQVKHLQWPIR